MDFWESLCPTPILNRWTLLASRTLAPRVTTSTAPPAHRAEGSAREKVTQTRGWPDLLIQRHSQQGTDTAQFPPNIPPKTTTRSIFPKTPPFRSPVFARSITSSANHMRYSASNAWFQQLLGQVEGVTQEGVSAWTLRRRLGARGPRFTKAARSPSRKQVRRGRQAAAHDRLISVPTPSGVNTSSSSACSTRPSMMWAVLTPLLTASTA